MIDASRRRTRQSGQALVEWIVVSALALMAAVWAAGEFARQTEIAAAKGHAQWLWTVGQAIEAVMAQQDASIQSAERVFDGLKANTVAPAKPFLERMQSGGWLLQALPAEPIMPYHVRLLKLDQSDACASSTCVQMMLLLAVPKTGKSIPDASHLLLALQGKGLAVTDLAPNQLRGAAYTFVNPPVGKQPLPLGTVALLAWRHDYEPPYVRLNESREVTLAGGVVLGKLAQDKGPCDSTGLLMLGQDGHLSLCRGGKWGAVSASHDHLRACRTQSRKESFHSAWLKYTGFWDLLDMKSQAKSQCGCDAGFAAVRVGGERGRVGAVELSNGFLCQRL